MTAGLLGNTNTNIGYFPSLLVFLSPAYFHWRTRKPNKAATPNIWQLLEEAVTGCFQPFRKAAIRTLHCKKNAKKPRKEQEKRKMFKSCQWVGAECVGLRKALEIRADVMVFEERSCYRLDAEQLFSTQSSEKMRRNQLLFRKKDLCLLIKGEKNAFCWGAGAQEQAARGVRHSPSLAASLGAG